MVWRQGIGVQWINTHVRERTSIQQVLHLDKDGDQNFIGEGLVLEDGLQGDLQMDSSFGETGKEAPPSFHFLPEDIDLEWSEVIYDGVRECGHMMMESIG